MNPVASSLLLLSLWLCAGAAAGQEEPAPLLWHIESDTNTVYLLGSVHVLRPTDYPLHQSLIDAYEDADRLVMELDMDDLDPARLSSIMLALGAAGPGAGLSNTLGDVEYARAKALAADLGLELAPLDGFEPWLVGLTAVNLQLAKLGFDPSGGIDAHFAQRAQRDGKVIDGLETVEFQLGIFDRMPADRQTSFLIKSLEDAAALNEEIETLISAWKLGDAAALNEVLLEGFDEFPGLYTTLVLERNRLWARRIAELTALGEDVLVIVGALHLIGEDGVVAALRQQGYEPVQSGGEAEPARGTK